MLKRPYNVRHNKTGRIYVVLSETCVNATNGANEELMILYRNEDANIRNSYVRKVSEFWEKFTRLPK